MTRRINKRKPNKPVESTEAEQEPEKEVPAAVEVEEMPEEASEDTPTSSASRPRRVVRKNTLYHNADYDEELAAKEASEAPEKPPRSSTPRAPRQRNQSKPRIVVKPMQLTDMLVTSGPLEMSGPLVAMPAKPVVQVPSTPKRKPAKRVRTPAARAPKTKAKEPTPELEESAEEVKISEPAESTEAAGPEEEEEAGTSEPAKKAETSESAGDASESEESGTPAKKAKPSRKIKFHVPKVTRPKTPKTPRGKAKKEPKEEPPVLSAEKETVLPSKLGKSVHKPPAPIPVSSEHHLVKARERKKIPYNAPERMVEQSAATPPVLDAFGEPAPKKAAPSEPEPLEPTSSEPAPSEPASSTSEPSETAPPELEQAPEPEKVHPKLDDIVYADGADLVVGCDVEVELEDDGPPVLGPSVAINEEQANEADDDEECDKDEALPPNLEKQANKKRGRPKVSKQQKQARDKINREEAKASRAAAAAERAKTANKNQRYIKLFQDDVGTTPEGDSYATVIGGCLTELLRKDRILDLLTNRDEIELIRQGGWMLDRPPRLPPLTAEKNCFAFYIDGTKIENPKDLSIDDLKPWSTAVDPLISRLPAIKPNVRRHPVTQTNGKLTMCKVDPRLAELHLTEYSARLPRDMRLRKKIFYLSRNNMIFGNVLILYDYTTSGVAPTVLNNPHGNDYLRNAMEDALFHHDDGSPFEPMTCAGYRGGTFLKLKPNKLGWVHNKHQLLDVLYNKPAILEDMQVLNNCLPDLPPLIESVGVFVYFVPANLVINQIHHAADGLSPWTVNPRSATESQPPPRVRSSRRALELTTEGQIVTTRDPRQQSELILVETMSTLARCKRIRKRVIYIQQSSGAIMGNVCYVYEFLADGPIPELLSNVNTKMYSRWKSLTPKKEAHPELVPDNNVYEEDEYAMHPMDEDMIVAVPEDTMEQRMEDVIDEVEYEDIEPVDTLRNGYDDLFGDDVIEKAENAAPYYDEARQLESGHIYLTVRHKKIAASFETVLEWIANTNTVEDRGILNQTKPGHPPMVTNARAYAFFVAGSAIFPHDVNRDDFSPWSHNGNSINPTCYRTKVRKIGVGCDPDGNSFQLRETDYKSCAFHLVYLYSINPRDNRMRKKIFYLMETQSKMIVSHALIIYDYNTEGSIPRLNIGQFKQFAKKNYVRQGVQLHDVMNDVSDLSEEEKESPFVLPPREANDGTLYMHMKDNEFWNDRNRQLQFLVNKPQLTQSMGCLNNKVPDLPPPCPGKGTFIFFVNGEEINFRTLTTDRLAPWSENGNNSTAILKRPKSSKTPLGLNRQNDLRVWRTNPLMNDAIQFQLHVYTATLPRCPRLRKKVVYVLKDGIQIGYAIIMYCFTEVGPDPQPVQRPVELSEHYLERFPLRIQTQIQQLLDTTAPLEIAKKIFNDHGVVVNAHMLHYLRRQEVNAAAINAAKFRGQIAWRNADVAGPSTSALEKVEEPVELSNSDLIMTDMVADEAMVVEHTEVVGQCEMVKTVEPTEPTRTAEPVDEDEPMDTSPEPKPNTFLQNTQSATGFVRGNQRYDALWRIAQKSFGTTTGHETFDQLFRLLLERNEGRLLAQIKDTFQVDIFPTEVPMEVPLDIDEEIVEEVMIPVARRRI